MAERSVQRGALVQIEERRKRLMDELAELDRKEREEKERLADAGRQTLLAALESVKVGPMTRREAKRIANAIATFGGAGVVARLGTE